MMTTCTSLRSFVLSMLVCTLVTLASEFLNVVDAVIVSLDKDREECITRKIDVGVDQDAGGRQVMDFHVALHPKNVDSVEQDLTIWSGHVSIYLRDENGVIYHRAAHNITTDMRSVKDRAALETETVSLCLLHVNARGNPRGRNRETLKRVYVEHFDIDHVSRVNRSYGNAAKGVEYVCSSEKWGSSYTSLTLSDTHAYGHSHKYSFNDIVPLGETYPDICEPSSFTPTDCCTE